MIRLQEFYESPFEEIRGKWFGLEQYMDLYAEKNKGVFDYFDTFVGYNVPDYSLLDFFELFAGDLRPKERALKELLLPIIKPYKETGSGTSARPQAFYLIGAAKKDIVTTNHELAHAMFYLHNSFADEMREHISKYAQYRQLKKKLLAGGYTSEVLDDEVQAYLATSPAKEFKLDWGLDLPSPNPFKSTFLAYRKRLVTQKYY